MRTGRGFGATIQVYTLPNETLRVHRQGEVAEAPCDFNAELAIVQAPASESYKGFEVFCTIKLDFFLIGDSNSILKLTSSDGMDYTCLLYGKATSPAL